ncbi:MAG TPA: ABC transporter ATP-binding protein [Actinocrinis sp.]|nr:ABC transporter ATP-binding protein [Actinocrinis sp.]
MAEIETQTQIHTQTRGRAPAPGPAGPGRAFTELRLSGISRSYGTHAALRPLDLTIAGGEFVALLGPSGCGKTTALNCLAGLLPLTAGTIELDGRRIDTVPPEKRGFGMVFQNYALFPHLTARANIAFGLKMRKLPKAVIDLRVDTALAQVRLTGHEHKHPGQLSGGQQQRVAIARAVVLEPPLVLMDEPLSNLDASLRLEMRTEIRRIHQELGLTTVYVTHDQEEALSLADRLVVLRDGEVSQIGTPAQLYEHPASAHVAGFMGYRNLLRLDVREVHGEQGTVAGDGVELVGHVVDPPAFAPARAAIAAFRPEDLIVVTGAADPDPAVAGNLLDGTVEVVEYHGRERLAQVRIGEIRRVHVRTREPLGAGDPVRLAVPRDRVLLFPAEEDPR